MTRKNHIGMLLLSISFSLFAQVRTEFLLEKNWKFSREDQPSFATIEYNDSEWQDVTIPHDWAIYGPFDAHNDLQKMAITQDGQTEAQAHAGRTGGLPFVGVGWYRTTFKTPTFEPGKRVFLLFDGAMSNAEVTVNNTKVGYWPYGYNSFWFDVTEQIKTGEAEQTLAVRLNNPAQFSRWYPGAGIYRNVHVIVTEDVHVPMWGTQIQTPVVSKEFARVQLKTKIVRPAGSKADNYSVVTEIWSPNKQRLLETKSTLTEYDMNCFTQEVVLPNPDLWSTETPSLYVAKSRIYEGTTLKDTYSTTFGVRSIEIRPNDGFYLNGVKTVFKGVCMHHDLGPLGGAVNDAAIRRQIRIMKEMGANAIRTSHNMPAPELVRACDEMGMMLMAETFDEWKSPKLENSYNKYFDEWAEKDMINLLHQFRNSASIVMWCIGNEVPDQGTKQGVKINRFLQDICHREDPTRPVTNGMDQPDAVINNNFAATLDVAGFNYRPHKYQEAYDKLPQQIILGSETASTVSSRGVYKFPVERKSMAKYDDHQSSSYDVEHCSWSNLPEDDFIQHEDLPYCIGEFVWTGFDYIGEPTPYYTDWPSHSSLFGIVDLAGIPKDRYYLYRSHWNKEVETLHILPHWTWKERKGEVTPIFVYTSYPSAELFINGKSQGKRTKDTSIKVDGSYTDEAKASFERQKRYRLMWMDTKYEPGEVKVVAYDENGNAVAEKKISTAGKPHHIELSADRKSISADGKDLSFINVRVVDKYGNLCPDADHLISFEVEGDGTYRAAANGNSVCLVPFQSDKMPLFSGQLTAIVQSAEKAGKITLKATAKGVKSAKIVILTK